MNMTKSAISSKAVVAGLVLVLCAAAFVSAAYAYSANYQDTIDEKDVSIDPTSKYIYITGDGLSYPGTDITAAVEVNYGKTTTTFDEEGKPVVAVSEDTYLITDVTGDDVTYLNGAISIVLGEITIKNVKTDLVAVHLTVDTVTATALSEGKKDILKETVAVDNIKFFDGDKETSDFEFDENGEAVATVVLCAEIVTEPTAKYFDNSTETIDDFVIESLLAVPGFSLSITAEKSEATAATAEDLIKAFESDSRYITLEDNITLNERVIPEGTKVIDLNGKKLTSTASYAILADGNSISITNGEIDAKCLGHAIDGAELYMENVTVVTEDATNIWSDAAEPTVVTLKDVNWTSSDDACLISFNDVEVNVIGGTYSTPFGAGFVTNGSSGYDGQIWNITGAEFNVCNTESREPVEKTGNNPIGVAVQCHNGDVWNIKDCVFNITEGVAISVRGGTVNIENCEFNYTEGEFKSGQIQYTDNDIVYECGNAVAVTYTLGSYGATENSKVTVDGTTLTYADCNGVVKYLEFEE